MMKHLTVRATIALCFVASLSVTFASSPCRMGVGKFKGTCLCTEAYCDFLPSPSAPPLGQVAFFLSSSSGDRFRPLPYAPFQTRSSSSELNNFDAVVSITRTARQRILGFGGAFTDAAAVNAARLSPSLRSQLLAGYFSRDGGLRYSIGRVPMGSCDFSTHHWSYDESAGDYELQNFSLGLDVDPVVGKLPVLIRPALALVAAATSPALQTFRLFGSPWSPPTWMKTPKHPVGGTLRADVPTRAAWALYFSKFLTAYAAAGAPVWAVTVQNEPVQRPRWESMALTAAEEAELVDRYLGPRLTADHPGVRIIACDDQRTDAKAFAEASWGPAASAGASSSYVSGIGVHWYAAVDDLFDHFKMVADVAERYGLSNASSDRFILGTEACNGYIPVLDSGPILGDWERGMRYAHDIRGDVDAGAAGWVDWNLALDIRGGPNHASNFVDAPVLVVNSSLFVRQPMWYAMGHFSAFVPPGSARVASRVDHVLPLFPLEAVAFLRPHEGTPRAHHTARVSAGASAYGVGQDVVVVLVNRHRLLARRVALRDPVHGMVSLTVPPSSLVTAVWQA
eukprot:TRINITY_DN8177_c0_g1_i1.p1 TRINITY_DN8177_c0_g1~~TRINITY_DN8177_c0_g1_i1.p1  ORF type:complete len:566 (-),score=55.23 TRINITY_DN8177_c0_g1_i1:503-2200(-)